MQLILAMVIFMVSRKFHHSYGLVDWSEAEWNSACEKGKTVDLFNAVDCGAAERISCRHGWQW